MRFSFFCSCQIGTTERTKCAIDITDDLIEQDLEMHDVSAVVARKTSSKKRSHRVEKRRHQGGSSIPFLGSKMPGKSKRGKRRK